MTYLFIATQTPAVLAIYDASNELVYSQEFHSHASEALPAAFASLQAKYPPKRLIYTHSPGSFMALKIAYCFFATAAIALNIELFGISAFEFAPLIRANSAAAFVDQPVRLMPLNQLKQERAEYFSPDGKFTPPLAVLPQNIAHLQAKLIPDAKPEYCLDAY